MPASRIIILGVAAAAAGGAGYVAKNMSASEPTVMAEQAPQQPQIQLSDVLVLSADVPMGAPLGGQISWESWPAMQASTMHLVEICFESGRIGATPPTRRRQCARNDAEIADPPNV